jgi:C4-dicarboxylate-specific signal transduction histidine kinase
MLLTAAYSQLAAFGVLTGRAPNVAWMLGALLIMAYELGRDLILSRRERLELTELRGQLTQAERVSILGQLASTLTHELAQPLGASLVNVEAARTHLRSEKPDLEELRAILDEIGRDDSRAVEIIGRMRQFLKRRTIEMQPVSLEDVVQDVVSIVRSEANSKHVALLLRLEPGLPRVSGDRLHLSQVLLNLVTNSIHAVQSRPPDGRNIVVEAQSDGNGKVEMAVRDSGPGIPDDIADDVFEHFFTTKADGMGVGLALSRSIIEAHGGRLWIDHIPQHDGAIFRLTLNRA